MGPWMTNMTNHHHHVESIYSPSVQGRRFKPQVRDLEAGPQWLWRICSGCRSHWETSPAMPISPRRDAQNFLPKISASTAPAPRLLNLRLRIFLTQLAVCTERQPQVRQLALMFYITSRLGHLSHRLYESTLLSQAV